MRNGLRRRNRQKTRLTPVLPALERPASYISNEPPLPKVWIDEVDVWASGHITGLLCDHRPIGALSTKFVDEYSRWAYMAQFGSEHPMFPRSRRHMGSLDSPGLSTHRKFARAVHAGTILDGALSELGFPAPIDVEPLTIRQAIERDMLPGESFGDARKRLWERHIPIVHLASGVRQAWAAYGLSLVVRPRFWADFLKSEGKWVGLALQIAEERRQLAIDAGLIPSAGERLLTIGRCAFSVREASPVPLIDRDA